MKQILTLIISLSTLIAGQGQQMNANEWEEQEKTNIRLLPRYGLVKKTEAQRHSDETFLREILKQDKFKGNRTAASNEMIDLGFNYLYRGDVKTAMYRFNQAYLLDSLNSEIYWGYGAVYMTLGFYERAKEQYLRGLSKKPDNTHLLTDYGTYFMARYQRQEPRNEKNALSNLDSAITYLTKSYHFDPKDPNTTFKLSVCHWIKGQCDKAWKYYDECKTLGGQPITDEYTSDLKQKCASRK